MPLVVAKAPQVLSGEDCLGLLLSFFLREESQNQGVLLGTICTSLWVCVMQVGALWLSMWPHSVFLSSSWLFQLVNFTPELSQHNFCPWVVVKLLFWWGHKGYLLFCRLVDVTFNISHGRVKTRDPNNHSKAPSLTWAGWVLKIVKRIRLSWFYLYPAQSYCFCC